MLAGCVAPESGVVRVAGEQLAGPSDPRIGYIPEQPRYNGLAAGLSVQVNLTARSLSGQPFWLARGAERKEALPLLERFDVRPRELERRAEITPGRQPAKGSGRA